MVFVVCFECGSVLGISLYVVLLKRVDLFSVLINCLVCVLIFRFGCSFNLYCFVFVSFRFGIVYDGG